MSEDTVTTPVSGRRLTIGAVCAALRIEHPDISISKIRYLEEQGLLHPQRTRGGYRLFAQEDVERLRTILRLQRDEFLPLRVIREELEKAAEGARQRPRRRPVSTGAARGPRFGELISAAGVNEEFVRSLEEFGLIAAEAGRFRPEDVQIVAAAARLQRYGFDARHLRAIHSAIQREAGLVEQVLAPQLRSANPDRVGAGLEQLDELAGLCAELTESLLVRDLRRLAGATTASTRSEVTDVIDSRVPHPGRARLPEARDRLQGHHAAAGRCRGAQGSRRRAGRVRRAAAPRHRAGRRVARLHPRPGARDPPRRRLRDRAQARQAALDAPSRRAMRSSTARTASSSTTTRSSTGMRVLVHDDLLATGGTARATCDLAEAVGGTVVGCAFLIELAFLGGRARLAPFPVEALISYSSEG